MDAVLLSHLHGDHFDRVARRRLDRAIPVVTTPQAQRRLQRWGFSAADGLPRWASRELRRGDHVLKITSVPGVHGPGPVARILPEVMGSVLEVTAPHAEPFRLYVTGDTLYRDWLRGVTDRLGSLDAAVVHLGGTRILGILVTMDGDQGADLVERLRPRVTVPVHFDDYGVFRSPRSEFETQWSERGLPGSLRVVERGETVRLD